MTVSESLVHMLSDQGCGLFPAEEIYEGKRLFDLGFDSLRFMELVVLVEEAFGIEVPDELLEITSETTVGQLMASIRSVVETAEGPEAR